MPRPQALPTYRHSDRQAIAERLHVNKIHINDVTALATAWTPLSGRGAWGNAAAFGGTSDLDAYTQWQWVTISNEADVPEHSRSDP